MTWIYFLFIWLGILAVWYAVRRMNAGDAGDAGAGGADVKETFESENPTEPPAPTTTYKEVLSTLPKFSAVRFYLTSFSDLTSDDHKAYVPEELKWYNYVDSIASFKLVGTIPDTIRQVMEGEETYSSVGLPLKPVKLVGPSSQFMCGGAAPDSATLRSFTVMFYGRLNALGFDATNREIVFLQMFAENPNHVKWSITRKDATNSYIEVVLGNMNTTYRWAVPNTTLLSNGNPTLYALVYNVETVKRTITIYIGTNKYTSASTDMTPIRLGYTPMEINSLINLDMTLQAFTYLDNVLADSDIPAWTEHFVNESGGLARTLKFLKDTYASEITTLSTQLTNQSNSVDDLQRALEECKKKLPKEIMEDKKALWKIKMEGGADISTEDAKKCSILSLSSWSGASGTSGASGNVGIGTTGASGPPTIKVEDDLAGLKIISPVRR
jgi:hypothetical protein